MKKSAKKLIAAIMALSMSIAPAQAFASSALSVPEENREKARAQLNSYCTNSPELIDLIKQLNIVDEDIDDLWIWQIEETQSKLLYFTIEDKLSDSLSFLINNDGSDPSVYLDEIKAAVGYNDKFSIKCEEDMGNTYLITMEFLTEDHELNYRISEKASAIMSGKGLVGNMYSTIGQSEFVEYHIGIPKSPVDTYAEMDALTKEDSAKYNKILVDNGIRVQYRDTVEYKIIDYSENPEDSDNHYKIKTFEYAIFPEDMTIKEALEYTGFVRQTWGTRISAEAHTMTGTGSGRIERIENQNWLDGDANIDGKTNIADAAFVMQAVGNKDKYKISAQGEFNADSEGDGLTALDALKIQKKIAGIG